MMLNETTENFLRVMAEFKWPEPRSQIYRLYYNEDGSPKCYTMDDLPGKYVEVDRETFVAHLWNVRVINGSLVHIKPPVTVKKLAPNTDSGTPCHPQDVCVVVGSNQPHITWTTTTNEVS